MVQRKVAKQLLTIAIASVITVMVWIGFDVYREATRVNIPKIPPEQLAPLAPRIDNKIFETLNKRAMYTRDDLTQLPQNNTPTPASVSGQKTR